MKSVFSLVLICSFFCAFAQETLDEGVIMQVNGRDVATSEFVNVYTKNASILADEDKMSVEDYFELFKNYQLKLEEAFAQELDQDSIFIKEYKKYYKQLADNYIANGDITDKMIKETYNRLETEVKASHILINATDNMTEAEKNEALEKALEAKEKLVNGEDFAKVAKAYSDDPSAQQNGGNLGWFKAFKMVYPFENAAYQLKVGEISEPVKTRFGYHIIQKTDERKSMGKIKLAHIMVRMQQKDTTSSPEERINEIYSKIQDGENFQDLAKQFSQDESTAPNGGVMPAFGLGELNSPAFEEVAFSLTEDGQVAKPFETRFGWHIIKRLGTEPLESFEEKKDILKKRIKTSARSKQLNSRIQENIEARYEVSKDETAVEFLAELASDEIFKSQWQIADYSAIPDKTFLQIDEVSISWKDLASYVEKQQRAAKTNRSKLAIIENLADQFVYGELVNYHKERLPEIDPAFASTIKEYKNGLLLYEVMDRNIWKASKNDSLALIEYYNENATQYKSDFSIDVEMASFSKKREAKEFLKLVENSESFSDAAKSLENVIFQEKENKKTDAPALDKKLKMNEGVSKIHKHNGQFVVYNILKLNPVRQLEYSEVKGRVISDYQKQLEEDWVKSLSSKFSLVVNETEFNKIKKQLE